MLRLSSFELYSRWVPLTSSSFNAKAAKIAKHSYEENSVMKLMVNYRINTLE